MQNQPNLAADPADALGLDVVERDQDPEPEAARASDLDPE
jgi:hypothetical protein